MSVGEAEQPTGIRVGVDIGGTFTDLVLMDTTGTAVREKAFTTPGRWADGIFDGLTSAAERHFGLELPELLPRVVEFTHGTTIVTNVLAQMNGLRVGLITTKGFSDTLRIARSARRSELDLQVQGPLPELVAADCIVELDERVSTEGKVVVPLHPGEIRRAVEDLRDRGVEAFAVSLLWSFDNDAHEVAVLDVIREVCPDVPAFLSSRVHPVIREYERTVTTVLNAYVSGGVSEYLTGLEDRLADAGLTVPVGVMQCTGGITSVEEARHRPLQLLHSGPVGGVIASQRMAEQLGLPKVICCDLGGTSFDTALIEDGRVGRVNRADIEGLRTGLTLVDVASIGAGGGSIAGLDISGRPRLGPRSAGAVPGPVAYGRGGTEPTTTDIVLALGLLHAGGFMGGSIALDPVAADQAIETSLAEELEMELLDTCRGFYRVGVASMAQAVRGMTVERGRDPKDFAIISYGGAAALFIGEIAEQLGITTVVIPEPAAVFSAYGMLCGDPARTYSQSIGWNVAAGDIQVLAEAHDKLDRQGTASLGSGGDLVSSWEADLKFGTQAFEVTVPMGSVPINEETRTELLSRFRELYEQLYGKGTYWEGAEALVTAVTLRVTVARRAQRPELRPSAIDDGPPRQSRKINWPEPVEAVVARPGSLHDMEPLPGPAVVEAGDTTIFVPAGWGAVRDRWQNVVLKALSAEGAQRGGS